MLQPTATVDPPADALLLAVFHTVRGFRDGKSRGARALARHVDLNPGTLANKANPGFPDQELTLTEAAAVMRHTRDYRILQALCMSLDHVAHPLPDFSQCSDSALLDLWAGYCAKQGEHAATVRTALADGVVTRKELGDIRDAMQWAMAAGLEFFSRMEGLVREH